MDTVFGLSLDKVEEIAAEEKIPEEIITLANLRKNAKKAKDFALSDSIRNQILQAGYALIDTKDGFEITKR